MRILISNDDGIYSPGIAELAAAAAEFGEVRVVAPDGERSSASAAITATRPLSSHPTKLGGLSAFRVDGTPSDCVALGAHLWGDVDVVLSGMNIGLNLGTSIWHSGTLAAAKQAALLGMRGIALSAPAGVEDYAELRPWLRRVLEVVLPDTSLQLVNVNFPREPRGMVWTRVSVRHYDGTIVPTQDPLGRSMYWFTVTPLVGADEGTDRWALEQSWISLTPLTLDLTDPAALAAVRHRQPLDEAVALATATRTSPDQARTVREDESKDTLGKVAVETPLT